MKKIAHGACRWLLALTAGLLLFPMATAHAQGQSSAMPQLPEPTGFKDGLLWPTKGTAYGVGVGVSARHDAGPYQGQIYCPVTGTKLPANGSATAVQTTIGEVKPTGIQKFFGAKTTPGLVIYVCCPECAKAVKNNPQAYAAEVFADRSTYSFCFAKAPAQRPERASGKIGDQPASPSVETPRQSAATALSERSYLPR